MNNENVVEEVEEWRPIGGWVGWYEVSSIGRVRSVRRLVRWRGRELVYEGMVRKPAKTQNGYPMAILCKNGRSRQFTVHRLVALAFIENPGELPCIDHVDSDITNNRVTNLNWVTYAENVKRAAAKGRMGTKKRGEEHHSAILTAEKVLEIRRKRWTHRLWELEEEYGVSHQTLSKVMLRRIWKHLPEEEVPVFDPKAVLQRDLIPAEGMEKLEDNFRTE